ncbi:DUF2092 domain-containing protein [Streptomyces sp. NPDC003077]|uniref:LolA family protein n=1 Tax=Streptomyces sp. NPDC003077 TaxID=3154443 RepID=UPI0033A50AF9
MPRNQPTQVTDEWDGGRAAKRRKTIRYAVPVVVAGVAAATVGLVPAFAGSGSPDLPDITAKELIAKVAQSDVQQLSGTVRISTDLGLPALPGGGGAGAFGAGPKAGPDKGDDAGTSADPRQRLMQLASGAHTLRVAVDGREHQRVSMVDKTAEYSVVHNGAEVWAYDSGTNTAFREKVPADAAKGIQGSGKSGVEALPKDLKDFTPQEFAQSVLKAAGDSTAVTVDGTAKVAGRDAYQLSVKPKQSGSTVGEIRIAVDAEKGVPLKFTLTPKSGGAAAIEAGFTSVDFAKPDASTFRFAPPKGAKVFDGDQVRTQHEKELGRFKDSEDFKKLQREFKDLRNGKPVELKNEGVAPSVIGKGWASVVRIEGTKADTKALGGKQKASGDVANLLDSMTEQVNGSFGAGRIFSTRLVNALITDDGTVYAGAVDKQVLLDAANKAK